MRSLGCSPCTGAVRSTADTVPKIIEELVVGAALRASASHHRPRSGRVDGDEEARRILLMGVSDLLRICTAGSVDDGKSTLIGRLLYDSRGVYEDQVSRSRRRRATAPPARSTSRSSPTACGPSASRESPSTSRIATSRPRGASSSSPTRRVTSSTRATWRPGRRPRTSRSCWSTRATACGHRRGGTRASPACSASRTSSSRSTRWISSTSIEPCSITICDDFAGLPMARQLTPIPISALQGDNVIATSERTPWFDGAEPARASRNRVDRSRRSVRGHSGCPCSSCCGRIMSSAATRGRSSSGAMRPATPCTVWPSGLTQPRQPHRHLGWRSRVRRTRRCR